MKIPSLSGAYLCALAFEDPDTVRLSVVAADGTPVCVVLEGVDTFQADGVRQGNVVETFHVLEDVNAVDARLRRAFPQMARHNDRWLAGILARVSEGTLRFVDLQSSYGIRMSGLCRRVVIEADEDRRDQAA